MVQQRMPTPRNRRHEENRRQTFEKVKSRIVARVRAVCPHMSDAEFDEFSARMAIIEIKYSLRRRSDHFPGGVDRRHGDRRSGLHASPGIESDPRGNLHSW